MAHHRNFDIEMTVVPDAAGQYEAAFVVHDSKDSHYKFPPVGSYLTPDDAREQTSAWARKWIDANFPEIGEAGMEGTAAAERENAGGDQNGKRENARGDQNVKP